MRSSHARKRASNNCEKESPTRRTDTRVLTAAIAALTAAALLTACGNGATTTTTAASTTEATTAATTEAATAETTTEAAVETDITEKQAMLYIDQGIAEPYVQVSQYELGYSGELTPALLIKGLSDLTGTQLNADIMLGGDSAYIDWATDSTIFTGSAELKREVLDLFDYDTEA